MKQEYCIDNVAGTVMYGASLISDSFTGNGTLCQITFTVKQAHPLNGSVGSWLNFSRSRSILYTEDSFLLDFDLNEIPTFYESGYFEYVYRAHVEDVNSDGKVDMKDAGRAAKAYGAFPGHDRWDPVCDVNFDEWIDMKDVGRICRDFGKNYL